MKKTLGAVMFVHNGIEFDYHFAETIRNMQAFADEVIVLDAGSTDGTAEVCKSLEDDKTKVVLLGEDEWNAQQGKEKLAYFQNVAKSWLTTDYYMVIQADECLHEASFNAVREAMEYGLDAYMCHRINLWFNPGMMLTCEHSRMPCSPFVVRLAKVQYDSYGDGESIASDRVCFDFANDIRIYHLGFVRKSDVMKKKVIAIQEDVFLTPHDARLDENDVFNPHRYFNIDVDAKPIFEELPIYVQEWAKVRP